MTDPLFDRIEKAKAMAKSVQFKHKKAVASTKAYWLKHYIIDPFWKFTLQVIMGAVWIYVTIIAPGAKFLFTPVTWAWLWYRRLWRKVVYYSDEYGIQRFHKGRAGLMILATWFTIFLALPFIADVGIKDGGLYLLTAKRETIYLNSSQETDRHANTFSARGCETTPTCNEQDTLNFVMRPEWFNHIWSLAVHGTLYYPDYVAAAIPQAVSKCEILSYGIRQKFLMKNWELFPDILEVKCVPVNWNKEVK